MTQTLSFSIGGDDWTKYATEYSLTSSMGRAYDVLSFESLRREPELHAQVEATFQDTVFHGFVYSVAKTGHNQWRVVCRSNTAKLTTPFSQPIEEIEPYTTATELIQAYATISGLSIEYRSIDLDLGASFSRRGTMLDVLFQIAKVTGSLVYPSDGGNKIIIEPLEETPTAGDVVQADETFGTRKKTKSIENAGVGKVVVSTGTVGAGAQKLKLKVNGCNAETVIRAVPLTGVVAVSGISPLHEEVRFTKETREIVDEDTLDLSSEISSIYSVLNVGHDIGFKKFEGSSLVLHQRTTGIIEIAYFAKVMIGYANLENTPQGIYYQIELSHNKETIVEQGFAYCKTNSGDTTCNFIQGSDSAHDVMFCLPNHPEYVKGFNAFAIGAEPSFRYLVDEHEVLGLFSPSSEVADYTIVEKVEVYPTETGGCEAVLRTAPSSVRVVFSSDGEIASNHYSVNGKRIAFDRCYHGIRISYNTISTKYHFQHENVSGKVELLVSSDKNTKKFELFGFDKYDINAYPCVLPQDLPVDMVKPLDLNLHDSIGKAVTVYSGGAPIANTAVDNFGFVFVHVNTDGEYRCSYDDDRTKNMVLKVSTGG